jgi:hypothetical protein
VLCCDARRVASGRCAGADRVPVTVSEPRVSTRDPAAHAAHDHLRGVADLLDGLRQAGADEQAAALTGRLPAAGMFQLFLEQEV